MNTAAVAPRLSTARAAVQYLWGFTLPITTLVFWTTFPHGPRTSLDYALPLLAMVYLDKWSRSDRHEPPADLPKWPFDFQLYGLFALQLCNYVALGVVVTQLRVDTTLGVKQALGTFGAVVLLTGINAVYSGVLVAHELVHRSNRIHFLMGRILLVGVFYEHFATEHVRGHHARVGTDEDPATARFGESFGAYFRRTLPAQFRSAWRLEQGRLNHPRGLRRLHNRVLQGVIAELALLSVFGLCFGPLAVFLLVVQACVAILVLETGNYIEHWGLTRNSKKVATVESWDAPNGWTLRTLVGLSRHADHHAHASRPYYKLRYCEESPKMPTGFYGTVLMALLRNRHYQRLATAELQRRRLGPFTRPNAGERPEGITSESRSA